MTGDATSVAVLVLAFVLGSAIGALLARRTSPGVTPARGMLLPGWDCAGCGAFNGAAKERLAECRACGRAGPGTR